jgi:hypothetical protein
LPFKGQHTRFLNKGFSSGISFSSFPEYLIFALQTFCDRKLAEILYLQVFNRYRRQRQKSDPPASDLSLFLSISPQTCSLPSPVEEILFKTMSLHDASINYTKRIVQQKILHFLKLETRDQTPQIKMTKGLKTEGS